MEDAWTGSLEQGLSGATHGPILAVQFDDDNGDGMIDGLDTLELVVVDEGLTQDRADDRSAVVTSGSWKVLYMMIRFAQGSGGGRGERPQSRPSHRGGVNEVVLLWPGWAGVFVLGRGAPVAEFDVPAPLDTDFVCAGTIDWASGTVSLGPEGCPDLG